ncbi:PAS domain-containing protein [Paracraurococcus ruber]|uniref:PAS domain-containing protein n=1 Tax=Paracraurococcus ruber TaxID=77675 RepID=A0ABS1D241_9PROT|nr:PAS domain-containing protein [Paracraurococcus ruber]MBK1659989.1 hypothetical protein [Paracraurococcus ruber]TDG27353.1 PAS domain-containing protein [Paracraurococcus ruber]
MTHPAGGDGGTDAHPAPPDDPTAELALLRTVLEAIGETIIVTDAGHDPPGPRIEYVNPAFTRMTGYAAAEVIGRTPRMLQGRAPTVRCSTRSGRRSWRAGPSGEKPSTTARTGRSTWWSGS